jgi:hypothetical protein
VVCPCIRKKSRYTSNASWPLFAVKCTIRSGSFNFLRRTSSTKMLYTLSSTIKTRVRFCVKFRPRDFYYTSVIHVLNRFKLLGEAFAGEKLANFCFDCSSILIERCFFNSLAEMGLSRFVLGVPANTQDLSGVELFDSDSEMDSSATLNSLSSTTSWLSSSQKVS